MQTQGSALLAGTARSLEDQKSLAHSSRVQGSEWADPCASTVPFRDSVALGFRPVVLYKPGVLGPTRLGPFLDLPFLDRWVDAEPFLRWLQTGKGSWG